MLFCYLSLLVTAATAAVVQMPVARAVAPAPRIHAAIQLANVTLSATLSESTDAASVSTLFSNATMTSSHESETTTRTKTKSKHSSSITAAPTLPVGVPIAGCTPATICIDAMTCGLRYGGCYDQNFCDGITSSYPTPTCTTDVVDGLTQNRIAKEHEQAGGSADAVVEPK